MEDSDLNRKWRRLHLSSGMLIGLFLIAHMANHVAMFWGQAAHIAMMETLRPFYRNMLAETVLMLALAWQIVSGLTMIWRTRSDRQGLVPKLQMWSGIILALFLANHVGAVWGGRLFFELDTNYHFAAAGMHAGYAGFFVPYYFVGVAALFVHAACALSWRMKGKAIPLLIAIIGVGLGAAFVATMFSDPAIPSDYLASYP